MSAEPVILLAEDLTPSDTAGLDPAFILGFCTAGGGPTSHSAIIARALGIPAIVGAGPAVLHQPEGGEAILDGNRGSLFVAPSLTTLASARQARQSLEALREAEKLRCYEPAMMTDGHRVEVVANIGKASEAEQAVNAGGEGVGLLANGVPLLGTIATAYGRRAVRCLLRDGARAERSATHHSYAGHRR